MLRLEGKSEKKNLPTETGYFRGFALQLKKKIIRGTGYWDECAAF